MATGGVVTDLDKGDVLGPIEYTLSTFVVREYAHAVEMHHPCFQDDDPMMMPPSLIHLDKLRLYAAACPKGTGPTARIHYEYDCEVFAPVHPGDVVVVSGEVVERFEKKGRDYVAMEMKLHRKADGALLVRYLDHVILAFSQAGGTA